MSVPYYRDDLVTLYHGDCREEVDWLEADVLVTDPPYGVAYNSGFASDSLARSIAGDTDTSIRDWALDQWGNKPALVFGSWKPPRPAGTHTRLIWDTKGALGMGDLSIPWKPSDQEIYVLGKGFLGTRDSNVLTCAPVQSMAKNGRLHPHQKPVALLERLIDKCPPGVIADPFAGSGSTLVAAAHMGRRAIGIELDEKYCEMLAGRLSQAALDFTGSGL
ncbi:site-specific DNA-methyltransferase [Prescottella equi]|uniref:DNA-methyltransferase n=1 Tax=Rhodococcus hoagii TaxID=43767 RepID=UPI001A02D7B3|nr:DNA methyltransferase [Prescottella equi]MBM4580903.1 site-specific DNA-methyltransferase [Prescottella equi]MBM4580965.1 site-specific DNA-methyltransferase [Prescottella equi]MBM4581416.1 site-specific DNA-methyltransferase [Prescottella equi]MBM4707085.1 site-specific DNA-methyltransferase [Prescottella equi]MCU7527428.1 site-specific DNA-methyltransferase [Prescottella equi]